MTRLGTWESGQHFMNLAQLAEIPRKKPGGSLGTRSEMEWVFHSSFDEMQNRAKGLYSNGIVWRSLASLLAVVVLY